MFVAAGIDVDTAGFTLTVGGNINALGVVGTGAVLMTGNAVTIGGRMPNLTVTGHVSATNAVSVAGNMTIIGAQGYWYKQIDGYSGSGAVLGSFMGESFGLGPAILWSPEALKGKSAIVLKWVHDISQTNRLNGDWGQVSMSFRF